MTDTARWGHASLASGFVAQPSTERRTGTGTGLVNLNTATQAELEALPGFESAPAKRIIAGRPYRSAGDLERVQGIGPATVAKIRGMVMVNWGNRSN